MCIYDISLKQDMGLEAQMAFVVLLYILGIIKDTQALITDDSSVSIMCFRLNKPLTNMCFPKRRRYDIHDYGYDYYFHGWVDVQGQGAQNDYCRFVGNEPSVYLSCALAGTHGQADRNYNSAESNFEIGVWKTWYMKDEDNDGREDYCRCLLSNNIYKIICTKAGEHGFYGSKNQGGSSNTFEKKGTTGCNTTELRPEFGQPYAIPHYP